MATFNGNTIQLLLANTDSAVKRAMANAQADSLSYSVELVECTKEDTGTFAEFIPGKRSASISFSGLTDYGTVADRHHTENVVDFFLNQNKLYILFDVGQESYEAECYIESMEIEGSTDSVSTYSGTLRTTGDVTKTVTLVEHFLLKENGDFILQENGDKIIIVIPE